MFWQTKKIYLISRISTKVHDNNADLRTNLFATSKKEIELLIRGHMVRGKVHSFIFSEDMTYVNFKHDDVPKKIFITAIERIEQKTAN